MNSDRDLLKLFDVGAPLSPGTIEQLIEKNLLKWDGGDQPGVWLTDIGRSLLKSLPPGDSASCPDEDAYQPDMVNHPPHYKQGDIECIDAIKAALTEEEYRGYCKGNALKYIWRERHKGGSESLAKAAWYLDRIELRYGEKA